ncbi:MAG TPA: TIGR03749 family integrating conjugative element protein, partial [Gammaproteobacteria bacterium]|nr:TIGR03749 family integrating conjugative element protein [Gammaproteobacteria bacterium]
GIVLIASPVFAVFTAFAVFADLSPKANTQQIQSEHVIWNKIPISFVVPVNTERLISFPGAVVFHNADATLTTDKIAILNNAGTLYIKAKQAFDPIRVPIILKETGDVILLDLSAKANADDSPVEVLLPASESDSNGTNKSASEMRTASVDYPRLMRFAIQQLYAPMRLVHEDSSLYRTPMYTSTSVFLVPNNKVITMPLISWRGGDLYITAILLKNLLRERVHLNPTELNGRWLAASYYPTHYLTPKGTEHDRTTLFLISNRPFNEALNSMREYR